MATAFSVVRCTLAGSAYGGQEQWSTGFWLGSNTAEAPNPTVAHANAIKALFATLWGATRYSSTHLFEMVKLQWFDPDEILDRDKTVFADFPSAVPGGSGIIQTTPQVAIVISLRSDRSRGKGSHGRMFIPGISSAVGSDGHIATTTRDAYANDFQTFFNGVRASAAIPYDPILVAKGSNLLGDTHNDIVTHIQVGNVLDTQRRRRNELVELYADRVLT